jgi:hypothetical protein
LRIVEGYVFYPSILTRDGIAELLQVDLHDDSIHYLAYPDVEPPRRAHSPVLPSDEEISFLFLQPFILGTPKTPDRLICEVYVVHYALWRFVLYKMGNAKSLTGVQQWLLMHVMAKRPFDIVDIMPAEIRGCYYGWHGDDTSAALRTLDQLVVVPSRGTEVRGMLESSKFVFPTYRPPMPDDRRSGPRGLRRAEETLQARVAAEAVMDEAA